MAAVIASPTSPAKSSTKSSRSTMATKFRYMMPTGVPSPPLEERARERRPYVSKFLCQSSSSRFQLNWPLRTSDTSKPFRQFGLAARENLAVQRIAVSVHRDDRGKSVHFQFPNRFRRPELFQQINISHRFY